MKLCDGRDQPLSQHLSIAYHPHAACQFGMHPPGPVNQSLGSPDVSSAGAGCVRLPVRYWEPQGLLPLGQRTNLFHLR